MFTLSIFYILDLSLLYYEIGFVGSGSHYVPGFGCEFDRVCWSVVNCLGIDGFWVFVLVVLIYMLAPERYPPCQMEKE